jgi:putative phosphoesterase
VLAIVSDTHGTDGHRLEGRTLEAVREADTVVHAGDFTTEAVYDAFAAEANDLVAVHGNNDDPSLVERLPSVATFEREGWRFVVVHGHEHSETSLSMLARQENADVVVVGHSHRPELGELAGRVLVNPGSHADPRQFRPGHAEATTTAERLVVRSRRPGEGVVGEVSRTS